VSFGDIGCGGHRLARHAPARAQRTRPFAQGDQEGVLLVVRFGVGDAGETRAVQIVFRLPGMQYSA
jgi:hypothetical protein